MILSNIEEVENNIIGADVLQKYLKSGEAIILNGKSKSVAIGHNLPIKINTSIGLNGVSSSKKIEIEMEKVKLFSRLAYGPDIMMDLSISRTAIPMYERVIETFGGPVGTLPHYLCFNPKNGIDKNKLLDTIEMQAEAGIAFVTLHPTPTPDILGKSKKIRKIPYTSRGGSIVIKDMLINNRKPNIIAEAFSEILTILKKHNVCLSIGTCFRPASIDQALDLIHIEETEIQGEFINYAQNHGVPVMFEGVGHMDLGKINDYAGIIGKYKIPFMPLGPITTDSAIGEDHITNAIGASNLGMTGAAHVFNSVTREEHTGKVPSMNSILESIKAIRVAAHSVNVAKFPVIKELDKKVAESRADNFTCVVHGGLFGVDDGKPITMGCTRCGHECPFIINKDTEQHVFA